LIVRVQQHALDLVVVAETLERDRGVFVIADTANEKQRDWAGVVIVNERLLELGDGVPKRSDIANLMRREASFG
jgi:hypothetical protein